MGWIRCSTAIHAPFSADFVAKRDVVKIYSAIVEISSELVEISSELV